MARRIRLRLMTGQACPSGIGERANDDPGCPATRHCIGLRNCLPERLCALEFSRRLLG